MNQAELAQWKTNPITKEVFTLINAQITALKEGSLNDIDFNSPFRTHAETAKKIGKIEAYEDILYLKPTEEEDE